jgi:hypothetical protein
MLKISSKLKIVLKCEKISLKKCFSLKFFQFKKKTKKLITKCSFHVIVSLKICKIHDPQKKIVTNLDQCLWKFGKVYLINKKYILIIF